MSEVYLLLNAMYSKNDYLSKKNDMRGVRLLKSAHKLNT